MEFEYDEDDERGAFIVVHRMNDFISLTWEGIIYIYAFALFLVKKNHDVLIN